MMSKEEWSIEKSKLVYGIGKNDLHFLDIDDEGKLVIRFFGKTLSFEELTNMIHIENGKKTGYTSSFTLRIPQLIAYQIKKIKDAFSKAISEASYEGEFSAVYPVKVNQRKDTVLPVLLSDEQYGLEAGTKAELHLIKSVLDDGKHRLIICNGAKDPEYLRTIKMFIEEGYNIAVSVESLHEAKLIVDILPIEKTNIVLRIKPYLTVRGHWSHSAGRDSKFGLSIHDLLDVIVLLKETGHIDCVTTILGHVGSQITAIEDFRKFSTFMTHAFFELQEMGLNKLRKIDFGGGLAIDYTSTHQPNLFELYAQALVDGVQDVTDKKPGDEVVPDIMIESGRGITALSSLIVIKALEVRSVFPKDSEFSDDEKTVYNDWKNKFSATTSVNELIDLWSEFQTEYSGIENNLEALYSREAVIGLLRSVVREHLVRLGASGLKPDALIERLWYPDHIVIGNFSVFNSIGDWVLVKQHFPIFPIRDLHVRPETTIRLVDITCDSDGEFSQFHRKGAGEIWFTRDYRPLTMNTQEMGDGIPVGYLKNVQGSYFVVGLTGAYQDVIEMNHNLLGDLPDVHLTLEKDGEWKVVWSESAQSIDEILEDFGYLGTFSDEDPYMD